MHGSRIPVGVLAAAATLGLVTVVFLRPALGPVSAGQSPTRPGDVDCNESVDPIDAALILQLNAALVASLPCPANGDADRDGAVTPVDAASFSSSPPV